MSKWKWAKIDERVLRKLCSRIELSDTAIGQHFGVTREAIRLARNRLGITGRGQDRLKVVQERLRQELEKRNRQQFYERNPVLKEIKRQASKRGVDFELLMWHPFGNWIRLGDRMCYLSRAGIFTHKHTKLSYVLLRRPNTDRSFDVAIVKLRRGWMVLPPDKLPKVSTLFVVGRKKKVMNPGKTSNRRDWANYHHAGWNWLREFADAQSKLP